MFTFFQARFLEGFLVGDGVGAAVLLIAEWRGRLGAEGSACAGAGTRSAHKTLRERGGRDSLSSASPSCLKRVPRCPDDMWPGVPAAAS